MTAYYNENDPKAAEWLRQLIHINAIAPGEVDERSIEDVTPADLAGYTQCHFFAGIGGWSLALRLAGWPDDEPVWTGSCPCQPFSQAGAGGGTDDSRHLWPAWRWLIDQCRPARIFGEQVASPLGRGWFAGVRTDLEAMEYAAGGADLCAAGVGAPHIRQRLYWMGDANGGGWAARKLAASTARHRSSIEPAGGNCGMADPNSQGPQGRRILSQRTDECAPWSASLDSWIPCADGKARRIEPGLEPLVNGLPNRVGLLRGYGNAIVPWLAATFIEESSVVGERE